ncbi:hypothetical protein O181_029651 [Austropuccinia psidii MF-1]|uniref:Uncharacterized protein n=1 Tax=Austropuccinia psidii MF-1 TaxID=1389203 RepID=A0A9Q3CWX3_9BASI|nr:hypothetical protein [Austropuccinia psidii MF-1]
MRLRHCPPSPPSPLLRLAHPCLIFSLAYNPYAASGPSSYSSNATLTPHYTSLHPHYMPLMLLTILTLAVPPNMPPMLLTILTLAVPSRHASNAPYHTYSSGVPSQHASNAAYHPYSV